jgi:predicted acetylornithine/succinylornithine family transaminase
MERIIEIGNQCLVGTYGRFPVVIDKGEGVYLYDTSGKKYLDFLAGVAVNSLGYGDKDVIKAIENQAKKLTHCSNYYYNEPMVELSRLLVENSCFDKVFFSNSGSEAVETAIKLAKKYKKGKIIAMKNSFHGRTCGSLSVTGQETKQKDFLPLLPNVAFGEFNNINSVRELVDKDTSAIIIEPVQGEGGVFPAKKEFLSEIRKICDKNDILLIFDEVQCGIGRLGTLFAYQSYGVEPDIVCLAKALGGGLPIGATLVKKSISDVLSLGSHGSTFGGNLLITAVACVVVNKLSNNEVLKNVRENGEYFVDQLRKMKNSHVIDVRGTGLMIGVELDFSAKSIIERCMENGLLLASAGTNVLRFTPPLIIERSHIDKAVEILKGVL